MTMVKSSTIACRGHVFPDSHRNFFSLLLTSQLQGFADPKPKEETFPAVHETERKDLKAYLR
jgi:hypothetical protein